MLYNTSHVIFYFQNPDFGIPLRAKKKPTAKNEWTTQAVMSTSCVCQFVVAFLLLFSVEMCM
jgi:hypothetical protein